ncbi:hypothetical protein ACJ41O_011524 [Fusarium nematophilum]
MAAPRAKTKIVIVAGGGTMGSSTALHLIRSGYNPSNITVLDMYPIPSSQSAGHDLNKIVSIRIQNKPDLQLSLAALDMWKSDPLFRPYFHNVGVGIADLRRARQNLISAKRDLEQTNVWLDDEDEILAKMPAFTREQVKVISHPIKRWQSGAYANQGWKGVHGQDGGWLAAAKAINAIGEFLRDQGVKFGFGRAGTFAQPLLSEDGKTCTGVQTLDGTNYYADKVVLATGAWSPALVDLEGQCVSKAWVFAHIQLTPEEAAEFKKRLDNIIKVCDEFPGFTRFISHKPFGSDVAKQISVPRSHSQHPTDTYPDASEASVRKAVARFLPRFKDRQLLNRAMCWCTDTADANLLICEHPRWKNFILATGDSGFKFLPNIGKHVVELIEGTLSHDLAYAWRWRPGGDALKSGRAAHAKDLADVPGWKHDRTSKL